MPLTPTFSWSEDHEFIFFEVRIGGVKASQCDITLSPLYVKVNHAPHLFEQDLLHEIDLEHLRLYPVFQKLCRPLLLNCCSLLLNQPMWEGLNTRRETGRLEDQGEGTGG